MNEAKVSIIFLRSVNKLGVFIKKIQVLIKTKLCRSFE